MNLSDLIPWIPRAIVAAVIAAFLFQALVIASVVSRAAPPEGPVVAAAVLLLTWGSVAYVLYRFDGAREWLLGRSLA